MLFFKRYIVGLFEEVGYLSNFRAAVSESDTFVIVLVFVCVLRCNCAIRFAMWEWEIYCCSLCFIFFAIQLFSVQFSVVVTTSC